MPSVKQIALVIAAVAALSVTPGACAEKTDPSMIPPDVTFTTASPAAASSSPAAPGLTTTSAAAAAQPPAPGLELNVQGLPPMTVNGFAIPKTSRVSAAKMKPAGTAFGMGTGQQPSDSTPQQSSGLYKGSGVPVDPNQSDPLVLLATSKGSIQIRLFRRYAPITVDNFLDLVNRGFYNGLTFHRVEPGFCIQGGCPNGTGTGTFIDPATHLPRMLPLETSASLKHNAAGVVAMARMQSQNSGSCQFYITLSPQPSLDMNYAVFGGVVSGLDVVQKIQKGDRIESITVKQ